MIWFGFCRSPGETGGAVARYGKLKLPFLEPRAAAFAHRSVGDVVVPIALLVGWMCYAYSGFGDGPEHAFDGEETWAAIHAWAGAALLGIVALKVVVVRWWKGLGRFLPHLGLTRLHPVRRHVRHVRRRLTDEGLTWPSQPRRPNR